MVKIATDVIDCGSTRKTPPFISTADSIRSVALHLFVTEGYQSVSLRYIADRVGIQAGSLYNHIESKQTLLFDFIEELEYNLLHVVTKYPVIRFDVKAGLKNYIGYYVRFSMVNRDLHILSRREFFNLSEAQKERIKNLRGMQAKRLQEIIAIGNAQEVFSVKNRRIAADAVLAMLDGVIDGELGGQVDVDVVTGSLQHLISKALSAETG